MVVENSFTAAQLIEKRETAIADIKKYWGIIYAQNVFKKSITRDFDIITTYKKVSETELNLIKVKMAIQAINMGLSSMDEMKKDNLYFQIFYLQQLKERKVKLQKLPIKPNASEDVKLNVKFVEKEIAKVDNAIKTTEDEIKKHNLAKKFKF